MRSHSAIAALLSGLWMGLGQIYNRQYVKGIFLVFLELFLIALYAADFQYAMWGIGTLGETKQQVSGFDIIQGDNSVHLMINGLIFLVAFALIMWTYVINVRDAYKVAKLRERNIPANSIKQTLKSIYENGFPYILLLPPILATAFLIVLPNLFGILLAFTNYSSPHHLPPKNLVDWVGLQTFIDLFKMEMWSGTFKGVFLGRSFGQILSTATFFGGLFVAILINQKELNFKNFGVVYLSYRGQFHNLFLF
jgi:arabinogalactan oligomer/maltooligosaccharide transport system permease protein